MIASVMFRVAEVEIESHKEDQARGIAQGKREVFIGVGRRD